MEIHIVLICIICIAKMASGAAADFKSQCVECIYSGF